MQYSKSGIYGGYLENKVLSVMVAKANNESCKISKKYNKFDRGYAKLYGFNSFKLGTELFGICITFNK